MGSVHETESIPLTEYFPLRARTPGTRETLRNSGVTESVNFPHFEDHHLKFKPDCDLCAVQCQLIEEAVGAFITEIVIKIPITNLGKDITGDLAA